MASRRRVIGLWLSETPRCTATWHDVGGATRRASLRWRKRTRTQKPRKLVYKRHHCLSHTTNPYTLSHFYLATYLLRNNRSHTNTHITLPNTPQPCLPEATPSTSRASATRPPRRKSETSSASGTSLRCYQQDHQHIHGHTNTYPAARSPTLPSHPSPKMRPASHTP